MKQVLLVDPNTDYSKRIENYLNTLPKPLFQISSIRNFDRLHSGFDLFIIHESFVKDIAQLKNSSAVRLLSESSLSSADDFSRLDSPAEWRKKIIVALHADSSDNNRTEHRLLLYYCFQDQNETDFRQIINRQKKSGKRIFILPLKPLYQWRYEAVFHQGVSLSDCLLELEAGIEPVLKEFGHLFEKQKAGYFLPRPGKNSDDIANCSAETIDHLVATFRNFLEYSGSDAQGIIDAATLPFQMIKNISFQTDSCYMRIPEEKTFADRKIKELIAEWLAEKPDSTAFIALHS